jgi:hypothetical protein
MKGVLILVACAAILLGATVNRPVLMAVEQSINKRIEKLFPGEAFLLLGRAQGVYLDGYGAVFTANVNLAEGPGINPFRAEIKKSESEELRKRKLERLPVLRDAMRETMVNSAGMLDTVPADEQVVFSVSLFSAAHEDTTGLPSQIVMQASRRALVGFQTNPRDKATIAAAIKTREY